MRGSLKFKTLYKDNFNYYKLITKINPNYRLFFNQLTKSFEIINIAKNNEVCLNFNTFSYDLLKKLQKTKSKNSTQLFKSIDEHNQKIINKNIQNQTNLIKDKTNEILRTSQTFYFN